MNKLIMVAGTICVMTVVRAVEFPNPAEFNPTWESAKPGTSYSTDLPTAALLGNGSLGAVNGGDVNHKKFVLTRGDLWSCGDFTYGKKEHNIGPISFADLIVAPGLKTVSSTDTLDLPTATLVTEGKFGKGKVRLESYVAADEDLLVISGVSDTDDTWILRIVAHNQKKSFSVEAGISDDGFWVKRSTLNLLPKDDPRGWTTNATAAVSALGAELSALSNVNGIEARANASIRANKPFAFVVSTNPARRFTWEELAKIKAEHVAWWKEWWNRSRVTTGDAELDRFYYGQVYLLGAGVRFRLVEPRQQAYNNKMPEGWVHGKTHNSGEATLERDFKPGEVVSLTMTGDCAATAGGRNSLGATLRKSCACGGVVMRKLNRIVLNRFV